MIRKIAEKIYWKYYDYRICHSPPGSRWMRAQADKCLLCQTWLAALETAKDEREFAEFAVPFLKGILKGIDRRKIKK